MKPKFDLAAFLAVPAPVGAARSRGARNRAMAAATPTEATPTEATSTEASPPTPDGTPASTD